MEKIYMEDNNSQQKRYSVDFSVILSFVFAVLAVFSIATYGIVTIQGTDVVSYAAPIASTTGNSFNFGIAGYLQSSGTEGFFRIPAYVVKNSDGTYSHDNPVFCVEHNVNPPGDGQTLTKSSAIEDYGLLYILNNTYANGVSVVNDVTGLTGDNKRYVEEWVTQAAVWMYLYETKGDTTVNGAKGATSLSYVSQDLSSSETIYPPTGVTPVNLYTTYVQPLVSAAEDVSGKKILSVDPQNNEIKKTTDDKYYETPLINVSGNPSSDLKTFDVTISGVEGAILVDEDRNDLNATAIPAGKKFYVRVPIEKITDSTKSLTINVIGHFETLAGNYFTSTEDDLALQRVVTVTGATKDVQAGTTFEFAATEDTGMNSAQTIYFIGLIVLLCGVGIVYANAKPVESKQ